MKIRKSGHLLRSEKKWLLYDFIENTVTSKEKRQEENSFKVKLVQSKTLIAGKNALSIPNKFSFLLNSSVLF